MGEARPDGGVLGQIHPEGPLRDKLGAPELRGGGGSYRWRWGVQGAPLFQEVTVMLGRLSLEAEISFENTDQQLLQV